MPVAFHEVSPSRFPIQIWALDAETYELRWYMCLLGAGAYEIPGKDEVNEGRPLAVVVRSADGGMVVREP